MSHIISVASNGSIIRVTVLGQLDLEEYRQIVPHVDDAIFEFESARVIFDLGEYGGWSGEARWEDLDLELGHWASVERVAIIGAPKYEERVSTFCRPFTSATVRFFRTAEAKAARDWIQEGL